MENYPQQYSEEGLIIICDFGYHELLLEQEALRLTYIYQNCNLR